MSAPMRAKMQLLSVTRYSHVSEVLEFVAVAAKTYPADGSDEDNTYAIFSPSASIKINVCNPALIGKFNPGETYYIDFTPAPLT